ncbi:hypothetical protein DAKH74_011940 [Maudiozyma humilis]|uniref:Uncharacterized protein n=1 Tax=Maudiozyma humilis TaxID=51915 RepID=A0AAV5RTN0_MAUHU|nr:hypothetical protein DAKH74_011940 [Kazachstania humilis]
MTTQTPTTSLHTPLNDPTYIQQTLHAILGGTTSTSTSTGTRTLSLLEGGVQVNITAESPQGTTAPTHSGVRVNISAAQGPEGQQLTPLLSDAVALALLGAGHIEAGEPSGKNTQETMNSTGIAARLLSAQFGAAFDAASGVVAAGRHRTVVDLGALRVVSSDSAPLRGRVESVLAVGRTLAAPLC